MTSLIEEKIKEFEEDFRYIYPFAATSALTEAPERAAYEMKIKFLRQVLISFAEAQKRSDVEVLEGMYKMRYHDNTDTDRQNMGFNIALDEAITKLK